MKFAIMLLMVILLIGCGGGFSISTTHGVGSVRIASVPNGAEVYVDGVCEKQTDCEFEISAQDKHIIVLKKEGYKDFEMTFSLEALEKKEINIVLESL